MEYKRADQKDIEKLVRMRMEYLKEDFGELNDDMRQSIVQTLPDYFNSHLNKDVFAYIAEEEVAVGTAILVFCEKPANPNFITGRTGLVMNVYTSKEFRRRGIARKLMEMLLEDARNMKLDCIELQATECGYELYKKLGFKEKQSSYKSMRLVI